MYKTIIGLENVQFMRSAYGIEYDCIDPRILKRTLEHMEINNLFFLQVKLMALLDMKKLQLKG